MLRQAGRGFIPKTKTESDAGSNRDEAVGATCAPLAVWKRFSCKKYGMNNNVKSGKEVNKKNSDAKSLLFNGCRKSTGVWGQTDGRKEDFLIVYTYFEIVLRFPNRFII